MEWLGNPPSRFTNPNTDASRPSFESEEQPKNQFLPDPSQVDSNSNKETYFSQDSNSTLVIRVTPQGRTVHWEELGLHRSVEALYPQIDELPFQEGTPIAPSEDQDPHDNEDLYRKIITVRISKIPDQEDDSSERVILSNYNSNDFDEYLSDYMDSSPVATTTIKTSISHDPPFVPPTTFKLEDDQKEMDLYKSRRILNQKRALRRKCLTTQRCGDSFDYSNSDLRSMINIGCDARNVIISRRQEREEVEAYSPTSNYSIPDDYPRPRKRQHLHDDHEAISLENLHKRQQEKDALAQERFYQSLHGRCK